MSSAIQRSSNCSKYTDTVSTLVDAHVSLKGRDKCTVPLTFYSCQTDTFESIDAITTQDAINKGVEELVLKADEQGACLPNADASDIVVNARTNIVGARDMEYTAEHLIERGLTSNCYRTGNDPNMATHIASAKCHPMEAMLDEQGRMVKNYHMTFQSSLATCNLTDEAMPQLQEDLRKVAVYNAAQSGYTVLKPEDLACSVSVVPYV